MMFKNLPELIKINYITSISLTVISLILGIFLKKPELYLGFFYGFSDFDDKYLFDNNRSIQSRI